MHIHTHFQNHIYFTLEGPHRVIPSPTSPQVPFIPDTQDPPPLAATTVSPPPIYQEISEISTSRGRSAVTSLSSSTTHGPLIADAGATT